MKVTLNDFVSHGDSRGKLIALEQMKEIPFDIKRVFIIYDTLTDFTALDYLYSSAK